MSERTRQDIYYMERIHAPIILHPNDTVGELDERPIEVTERLPSRVEGRDRTRVRTMNVLAQVALHDTLSAYLARSRERNTGQVYPGFDDSWTLDDMPAATIAEFEAWRDDGRVIDIEAVRQAAIEQAEFDRDNDATYHCRDCQDGSKYACYSCGYARYMYRYPAVRYQQADVLLDVCRVITADPDTLRLDTAVKFDKDGLLMAERQLIFDARHIIDGGHELDIDSGEELARPVVIVLDRFSEQTLREKLNEHALPNYHGLTKFAETAVTSPEACLEAMQRYIALDLYRERITTAEDQARLTELRRRLGERGLSLGSEWAYSGMGDTDIQLSAARIGKNDRFIGGRITYTFDMQYAIKSALEFLDRRS